MFRHALSVSPFTEFVLSQGPIGGATTVRGVQELFVARGATEVFARVATLRANTGRWDEPSQTRMLERARLAVDLGLDFNPEFGLFDPYGDISHQPAPDFAEWPEVGQPAPWHELTLDQMCACLERYGEVAATEVLSTGARVNVWDVGNEVDLGTAGVAPRGVPGSDEQYRAPDAVDPVIGGRSIAEFLAAPEDETLEWASAHIWPYQAPLMAAFAAGVRTADPDARFATHLSGIAAMRPAFMRAFYDAMAAGGFEVDNYGTSYYPSSAPDHGIERFAQTVAAMSKPVFVAEYAFPAATITGGAFVWNHGYDGYPTDEHGQAKFYRDVCALPNVCGVRAWAPDLCRGTWGPMSLFDESGAPRRAMIELDA